MIQRFRKYLKDPEAPLYDRCFTITTIIAMITLIVIFGWEIYIGEDFEKLIVVGATIAIMMLTVGLSLRYHHVVVGSTIMSIGIIFVVLPVLFFMSGGVNGCIPIWYAYSFLFITLNMIGWRKYVFLVLLAGSAITCYVISSEHPEYVQVRSADVAFLDSIASLIGVGLMLALTVGFLTRLYDQEKSRAENQASEIHEMNKAQSHFFSSMSHEIRTPINTIIGLNEMILREDVSDEVAEDAMNIQSASRMLLHLINDILDMSKIESGQMELTPSAYHTGDMFSEIVAMLWGRAKDKGLAFHVSISPELPGELMGDEVRIKQILINVLTNSIKYTREGSVTLSVQSEKLNNGEVNVVYTVSDTGIGVKQENIPYLFTAFKRMDEEKNRYIEGTGLGLSIVKQLVDKMNGKITVNSVYTKGTTFIIEIPQQIIDETALGDYRVGESGDAGIRETYQPSFKAEGARILVVDDNVSNLMVVEKLLRDTEVIIDTAKSGAEALEKTLETAYPVIFMDHMMPEMDGVECFRRIRSQTGGLCRDSRVVALTANAGKEERALYGEEGFDGYLMKPVSGRELERELYRLLPEDMITAVLGDGEIVEESMAWMQSRHKKTPIMITTESVADLPESTVKKYHIGVLPHKVATDLGEFEDGIEIETTGLLAYMQVGENQAMTKPPSVEEYEIFFANMLERANNIIHISISSKVENSGYHPAAEAARSFENVTVIDSGHLSSGQGLMAILACRMVEGGRSIPEIVEEMRKVRSLIRTSFIVDSLDYLSRANQMSSRASSLARSFMVHPVVKLWRGKMIVSNFYFGTRESVWKKYVKSSIKAMKNVDRQILFVTYVGLSSKDIEMIRKMIEEREVFDQIIFQKASPAIAVNCGPGTFGLLFRRLK